MNAADEAKKKAILREQALARRKSLTEEERAAATAVIAERAAGFIGPLRPASVALYWAVRSECGTQSLIERLQASGAEIGLPAVVDGGGLAFRRYMPGDRLEDAAFAIREPLPSAPALSPDLVVLPVVGFDRGGMRLGYGRGHYDFAISQMRGAGQQPLLVGIAFSVQEVETIPAEPHDVRLDCIVTENETLEFRTTRG